MALFNSAPAPAPQPEAPQKNQRHMLVVVPAILLALASGYLTGNLLAGALAGLAIGLAIHGFPTTEAIRGDEFARRKVYRRPVGFRIPVALTGLAGAVLWLTGIAWPDLSFLGELIPKPDAGLATILGAAFAIVSIVFGVWGGWRKLGRSAGSLATRAVKGKPKPPTEDEKALLRFDENTLRQAGLGISSTVAHEEILPQIIAKKLDEKGRATVRVAVIPGRQTADEFFKAEQRIATAWRIRRVAVSDGDFLADGTHTVILTAQIAESLLPETIVWERRDANVPIVEYVKGLPMGGIVETGEMWFMDLDQRNFAISGQPGFGKSSFVNALTAHLLFHPDARVHFIDLKSGIESSVWANAINGITHNGIGGSGVEGVLHFLDLVSIDMSARYARMGRAGVTNAWKGFLGPDEPVKFLIIDEISNLFKTDTPESAKIAAAAEAKIQKIIEQGRAAGYVLALLTQYPTNKNLPTVIRENLSDSMAFRLRGLSGASAALGSNFVINRRNDPTKTRRGDAVLVNEDFDEGVVFRATYLREEIRDTEVIPHSVIKGKNWLDAGWISDPPLSGRDLQAAEAVAEQERAKALAAPEPIEDFDGVEEQVIPSTSAEDEEWDEPELPPIAPLAQRTQQPRSGSAPQPRRAGIGGASPAARPQARAAEPTAKPAPKPFEWD